MSNMNIDLGFRFADHLDHYPPAIPRTKVTVFFPWLSSKRMANLDGLGQGPKQVLKNGRAIIYPTKSFLEWLDSRNKRVMVTDQAPDLQEEPAELKSKNGRKTKLQEVQERRG